jgi:oligosaccharide repeat unit polymerase
MQKSPLSIWWLHPGALFATAGVAIAVCAYLIPESVYRSNWRTPKFFDLHGFWITLACCAVFSAGTLLATGFLHRAPRPVDQAVGLESIPWNAMRKLFVFAFYLALFGYALWIVLAIQRGMTLQAAMEVISGEKGAMYDARFTYLPTVGGVTTLTQFGTAAAILGTIIGFYSGWRPVRVKLVMLVLLALLRALLNSERFALIELFVPVLVVALAFRWIGRRVSARTRALVRLAPVIGLAGLILFFTAFESLRSWSNFYADREQSLWQFGSMRLAGYYVTSFNNGAYFLNRLEPLNAPYFTAHFMWTFPLTAPAVKRLFPDPMLDTADKWFYFPFLEAEANVEFNNADGMLFPLMDFGVPGGLIYWGFAGLVCGWVYEHYRRRTPFGTLVYPLIYLALCEVPLALYWGEGRVVYSAALLIAAPAYFWMRRRYEGYVPIPSRELSLKVS